METPRGYARNTTAVRASAPSSLANTGRHSIVKLRSTPGTARDSTANLVATQHPKSSSAPSTSTASPPATTRKHTRDEMARTAATAARHAAPPETVTHQLVSIAPSLAAPTAPLDQTDTAMDTVAPLDPYLGARLLAEVARRAQHGAVSLPPRFLSETADRLTLADNLVLDDDIAMALDDLIGEGAARGDVFLPRNLACLEVCRQVQAVQD